MVAAVRAGASLRRTARRFGVSLSTLPAWVRRARGRRLDRVDRSDRPRGPRRAPRRSAGPVEEAIGDLRRHLREAGDLGEFGAAATRWELLARGAAPPAVRTIHRVLERRGLPRGRP